METGRLISVWGLPRFGWMWYACPLQLKVYPWGIRIGTSSKILSGITMIPRVELPWQALTTVFRRGRTLRIMRDDFAPITFLALGDVEKVVRALEQHSVSVEVVRDWPSGR
jgi:hypothetical protein